MRFIIYIGFAKLQYILHKGSTIMKYETIKNSATTAEMVNALAQLMKDNLVGMTINEGEGLCFTLPNGQTFLISVQEAVSNTCFSAVKSV